MKNLLSSIVLIILAFCSSCNNEPIEKPEEKPFPMVTWRTTHQYFCRTVDSSPEEIKAKEEKEISEDASEAAETYQLVFNEDGTGHCTKFRDYGATQDNYDFTWETYDGLMKIDGVGFYACGVHVPGNVWNIEESITDKMILVQEWNFDGDGPFGPVYGTDTYRYTFERVK